MVLVYKSSILFGEKMDRISSVPYKKLVLALKNNKENGYWDALECEKCHFPGNCPLCGAK
jgi:primosomal protein N'